MSSSSVAGQQHRRDIDGLRAVAILSVLGYHTFARLVPGGYVGVDVFFVISGYLISGIVLRGLADGSFSFVEFYVRRIKRIFPALAVVLSVVWAIGWYAQFPDEYALLGKHIASGAAFLANVALWREAGYFDKSANLKPLLHLWSLGVEEQFYLLWPLTLFVVWRLRLNVLLAISALLAASFALNVLRVGSHEAATFYLPTTRLWELLLGALYARHEQQAYGEVVSHPGQGRGGRIGSLQSLAGLILIMGSLAMLDSTSPFPGWRALFPTVGTVLLIAGGPDAWINRVLLSSKPLVFIGLISYPLYLWHWPLLSFSDMFSREGAAPPGVHIALALLAGVLAWLTYRFVERPIRRAPLLLPVAVPLGGAMMALGVLGVLSMRGFFPPRSAGYGLQKIIAAENGTAYPGPHLVRLDSSASPLRRQGNGSQTVLFIGDSFIEQYYPRVDWLLRHDPKGARSVVFASNGGCPPIPGVREDHHAYCDGLLDRALQFAARPEVTRVVIGANWMGYFYERDSRYSYYFSAAGRRYQLLPDSVGTRMALASLQSMVLGLEARGKQVYVILQSPDDEALDPRRLVGARWGRDSFHINVPVVPRARITSSMEPLSTSLARAAQAGGARIIDPIPYLCDVDCLVVTRDGQPVYRDGAHLNPGYVRTRIRFLDSVVTAGNGG